MRRTEGHAQPGGPQKLVMMHIQAAMVLYAMDEEFTTLKNLTPIVTFGK
ncbi:MAG: hypothetical protein H0X26_08905 [Alphaproteobacteria bacterium]|nr:hypothetical protein [Alphaproteobacteria bacterium]